MTHELKTTTPFFDYILRGDKTADLRKNDRGFSVGDTVILREYCTGNPAIWFYTGRSITVKVTHITDFHPAIKQRFVMLSFVIVERCEQYTIKPASWIIEKEEKNR